jgi:hypothetical protein
MSLMSILNNYILYKNILKYLNNEDRSRLSLTSKSIYDMMNRYGYMIKINFKCDTFLEYLNTLNLMDIHKRTLKELVIIRQIDPICYLPKSNYILTFKNCKLNRKKLFKIQHNKINMVCCKFIDNRG